MANDTVKNIRMRPIQTYVLRAGRMTEAQKRAYETHSAQWCVPFQKSTLNVRDLFGNTAPTVIEIGFGMGQATSRIAQENPDKNYIGIEVHRAGVGRLLGDIERLSLTNLRIIEYDALETIKTMFPDNSVSAFHIFFPDPWQKKRHHKRRLVQRPITDLLAKKLISGGYLYMVTDWEAYGHAAYSELTATPTLKNRYEGFAPTQPWRPETRFEEKGKEANHEIFELMFEKKTLED
ncbi:MAG TPA: tRNA (guanosine(46)-N7)-methyltransferase TrmB [Treponema sp.]|nr:tRNA (guanosine(46)-N7)-methyltransferase TrmB [Treponema sp.]